MGIKDAQMVAPEDITAQKDVLWYWNKTFRQIFEINKACIDLVEDFPAGLLLSRVTHCLMPGREDKSHITELSGRRWMARTRKEWWEDCRMSQRQFDRAVQFLEDKKLIKTTILKYQGKPTKHISINWNNLLHLFQNRVDQALSGGEEKWK